MIVVKKQARTLTLHTKSGEIIGPFPVSLGSEPQGAKQREGDGKTPEGAYRICSVNPNSKFHFALGLSYPNTRDAKAALSARQISLLQALAVIAADWLRVRPPWRTKLGGFIMLHGESPEGKTGDWTAGCIALKNEHIERIAQYAKKGETVVIEP